ncbi:MAG: hypothetical protein ACRYE7_02785 [Janthinobacterium lividum]
MAEMLRLQHNRLTQPPACPLSKGINLLEYLKGYDFDADFPQVEWNQYTREENFIVDWDEEWKGNYHSYSTTSKMTNYMTKVKTKTSQTAM